MLKPRKNLLLLAYFILLSTFSSLNAQYEILAGQSTGPWVNYYDFSPDLMFSSYAGDPACEFFMRFDINNDGTDDLVYEDYAWAAGNSFDVYSSFGGRPGSQVVIQGSDVSVLDLGDSIHGGLSWGMGGLLESIWGLPVYGHGLWGGSVDKYLGFRINVNGDMYYGWLRMDFGYSSNFGAADVVIKDYAWCGDPTAVFASPAQPKPELILSPNPVHSFLKVQPKGFHHITAIRVYDVTGQLIFENRDGNRGTDPILIPVSTWRAGKYFLHLESDTGTRTQGFLKM